MYIAIIKKLGLCLIKDSIKFYNKHPSSLIFHLIVLIEGPLIISKMSVKSPHVVFQVSFFFELPYLMFINAFLSRSFRTLYVKKPLSLNLVFDEH